ncbi:MAG: hypothetical protein IPL92_15885 [Saprospiraceae bacterium]|nr:hypothetical protein [Candidatus Opimibacter iunctus]
MKSSLLLRQVLPLTLLYVLMIITVIIIDYVLHLLQIAWVGRQLGLVGTLFIVFSFIYSLRKRRIIKDGSPKQLLLLHEYLAWIGSVMLLVHAGIHFNAILPWLAVYMLLLNVASGFVGKYLLRNASSTLTERKREWIRSGLTEEEADKKVFLDSITVSAMQHWRVIHLPIAYLFGLLSLLHIITVLMYSK